MENHQSECNFLSTVSIFSSPPLAARCPLSPLLPAAAALSFCLPLPSPSPLLPPSLSPLLSSPSPLSRLRCPLLPLSLASAVLSSPHSPPLSCSAGYNPPPASLCLSLPLSALPLCIFLYISSLFSLLLFLFSLLLTIFYTFLSPFSPFPPPSALSLRQMWNFPILPSATN